MASPILHGEAGAQLLSSAPQPAALVDGTDVPRSIPTPATEFAPKGRIIDDSARGTIFWEADSSADAATADVSAEPAALTANGVPDAHSPVAEFASASAAVAAVGDVVAGPTVSHSQGKPFRITWQSTGRVPFFRTRGLRNPWNANREVKIARDGTELEPSVGERLVSMFHNPVVPALAPTPQQRQYQADGMPSF